MKTIQRIAFAVLTLAFLSTSAQAQTMQESVVRDLQGIADKVVGLAQTVPVDEYTWRPGEGIRSIGEVYMHIASANYRFPGIIGVAPPDGVSEGWVQGNAEGVDRETVVAALNASFAYLYEVVREIDDVNAPTNVFGTETNVRGFLLTMTTHLHEHLGQSIAYARTNGHKPPWSANQP